ncbi:MAG: AbrB/MazE/SpoVT family DNA-binding domain-containing protein, partial [Cloacibacillus evryensis]
MAELTTVSHKGQITIPKAFRDEFDIQPGDRVFFVKTEKGIMITKPKKTL